MTEPGILQTDSLRSAGWDEETIARIRGAWTSDWLPLREAVRRLRPSDGSPEEAEALQQFLEFLWKLMEQLGAEGPRMLSLAFEHGADDLWRREYQETSIERKLGMRHVGQAIQTLDELMREFTIVAARQGINLESDAEQARLAAEAAAFATMPPWARELYKLEFYTFVAFDLVAERDTGEFCEWARRAVSASREARAQWHLFVATEGGLEPRGDAAVTREDELRTHVVLDAASSERVVALLENPPPPNEALLKFLRDG